MSCEGNLQTLNTSNIEGRACSQVKQDTKEVKMEEQDYLNREANVF